MKNNRSPEENRKREHAKPQNRQKPASEKTIVKNANAAGQGAIVRSGEELDKNKKPPQEY